MSEIEGAGPADLPISPIVAPIMSDATLELVPVESMDSETTNAKLQLTRDQEEAKKLLLNPAASLSHLLTAMANPDLAQLDADIIKSVASRTLSEDMLPGAIALFTGLGQALGANDSPQAQEAIVEITTMPAGRGMGKTIGPPNFSDLAHPALGVIDPAMLPSNPNVARVSAADVSGAMSGVDAKEITEDKWVAMFDQRLLAVDDKGIVIPGPKLATISSDATPANAQPTKAPSNPPPPIPNLRLP